MTNREWEHRILEHKVAVSDTIQFTCGSASLSCFDPKRGMMYSVYHTSRTSYGESREVYALAIIPICQPHRTETLIILEHGQEEDGVTYTNIIDGNCFFIDGKVRIYFLSGGSHYFYRAFDLFQDLPGAVYLRRRDCPSVQPADRAVSGFPWLYRLGI